MMAYSLPVAALFAATMVYGRLSADNELTACRAGGISHLGVAMPAFVLGGVVAGISLLFLCFVVPVYTLKVEKVVYSNLAKLIANRIERTHEIKFGDYNVFAQKAYLPPPDPKRPDVQRVILEGVSIVTYEKADHPGQANRTDKSDVGSAGGTGGDPFAPDDAAPAPRRRRRVTRGARRAARRTAVRSRKRLTGRARTRTPRPTGPTRGSSGPRSSCSPARPPSRSTSARTTALT